MIPEVSNVYRKNKTTKNRSQRGRTIPINFIFCFNQIFCRNWKLQLPKTTQLPANFNINPKTLEYLNRPVLLGFRWFCHIEFVINRPQFIVFVFGNVVIRK